MVYAAPMKKRLVSACSRAVFVLGEVPAHDAGAATPAMTRSGAYAPTSVPFSIRTRWPWPNGGGLRYVNVRIAPLSICTCT